MEDYHIARRNAVNQPIEGVFLSNFMSTTNVDEKKTEKNIQYSSWSDEAEGCCPFHSGSVCLPH